VKARIDDLMGYQYQNYAYPTASTLGSERRVPRGEDGLADQAHADGAGPRMLQLFDRAADPFASPAYMGGDPGMMGAPPPMSPMAVPVLLADGAVVAGIPLEYSQPGGGIRAGGMGKHDSNYAETGPIHNLDAYVPRLPLHMPGLHSYSDTL
jgi:hypothetical protein